MKKNLVNSVRFIVDFNFWIALASFCFYQLSLLQLGESIQLNTTSIFIFFSTFFTYNILQFLGDEKKENGVLKSSILFSAAATFGSMLFLDYTTIVLSILAGGLTGLYAIPFLKIGNIKSSLRNFWFLKSVVVALVWTIVCGVIPFLHQDAPEQTILCASLEKFLFILGITIPYDIKDIAKDSSQKGMQSLAMKFGVSKTIYLSLFIHFLAFCLAWFTYPQFKILTVTIYFLTALVLFFTKQNRNRYWFTFLIDGLIILYFLLCLLFGVLK